MLPKTHILLGALFSLVYVILLPLTPVYGIIFIFLSSFLIDFDHYLSALSTTRSLSLRKAFNYHLLAGKKALLDRKKGIRKQGDFHLFHTLEFLILIFILSLFFKPVMYILIGMIFHSLLDLIYLINQDLLYRREFFLSNWIRKKLKNKR